MHSSLSFGIFIIACCCLVPYITADDESSSLGNPWTVPDPSVASIESEGSTGIEGSNRQKRTLLWKKKLIGAGLLGFGLGVAKGYKVGHYTGPQVRHVYLSPPPPPPPPPSVQYVEYVEKPIFVERIIERPAPIFKPSQRIEYKDSSPYGSW